MEPTGSKRPLIYILGEGPGKTEDARGEPFVGKSGRVLRYRIPDDWLPDIRWSNVVRTRPPENRTPSPVEIECCRPSVAGDIERTKPSAILGFGNIPLHWAIKQTGITNWAGRRVPVRIGKHTCWFYPMLHPSYVLRDRKFTPRKQSEYGSETEFAFANHLRKAFAEIESLPEPVVHTEDEALSGIDFVTGANGESDLQKVLDFIQQLYDKKVVGFDYETVGLRPYAKTAKILTIALSCDKGSLAFPLDHREAGWSAPQRERLQQSFEQFLRNAECRKVVHNLAFEQEWTAYFYGADTLRAGRWGDSMSQAYILDERPKTHSLNFLCLQYFGLNLKAISALDPNKLDETPIDEVLRYNALDAKYHRLLYLAQSVRLKQEGLQKVYEQHLRRVPTVVLTQLKGVPVDQTVVEGFYQDYTADLQDIESELAGLPEVKAFKRRTGTEFRPSANKEVATILHSIGVHEDTVDESVLSKVDHPFAKLQLAWREINKLLSTYVKPIRAGSPHLHPDGLLHPVLAHARTRTGRTSSEDPNIQNQPKREHREVRSQIRPGGDLRVVSIDYAQIQARNVAMESLDDVLVKAFWDRYDIHTDWMEKIAQAYPKWVTEGVKALRDKKVMKHYRDRAKNGIVFPSFFGARPAKVAKTLGIPLEIATDLSEEFWDIFGGIKKWHGRITKSYYKTGYVTGLSGYRRRAPMSPNELINAPIQADEAIIVLNAMARLSELEDDRYQANMEIHDDLTFIWPKKDIEKNLEVVIPMMINVPFKWAHSVPIGIEVSVGEDWNDMQGIGEYYSDQFDGNLRMG